MFGPSGVPGRGSRGDTNAGGPVMLSRASTGVGPRIAGLKPPPTLIASSAGLVSLGPLPWKRLERTFALPGVDAWIPVPFRAAVRSLFSQKMLLMRFSDTGAEALAVR